MSVLYKNYYRTTRLLSRIENQEAKAKLGPPRVRKPIKSQLIPNILEIDAFARRPAGALSATPKAPELV